MDRKTLCYLSVVLISSSTVFAQTDQQAVQAFPTNAESKMVAFESTLTSSKKSPDQLKKNFEAIQKNVKSELRQLLATNKSLQEDLVLLDYQRERIQDKWQTILKQLAVFEKERTLNRIQLPQGDRKDSGVNEKHLTTDVEENATIQKLVRDYEALVDETLVGNQMDRLNAMEYYLSLSNFVGDTDSIKLITYYSVTLGLKEEESRKIKTETDKIIADYEEKVAAAKAAAEKALLETIPENQRQNLRRIIDGEFKFLRELRR